MSRTSPATTAPQTLPIGVLCALPRELGALPESAVGRERVHGVEVLRLLVGGREVLACVGGVGKVAAAHAATLLLSAGAEGLLVVGTCGGLRRSLEPGTFVHCTTAFQADFAVREGRAAHAEESWRRAWRRIVPGPEGWFLTADRPVLGPWRRLRLARAFSGPCVADMETAAAGAVAQRAGVPWAALRVVTDGAGFLGGRSFARNYPTLAGRAADTLPDLLPALP